MQDLRALLIEAGQELPVFLKELGGPQPAPQNDIVSNEDRGCSYCSGLGHRITNCPKLESIQAKVGYSCVFMYISDLKAKLVNIMLFFLFQILSFYLLLFLIFADSCLCGP